MIKSWREETEIKKREKKGWGKRKEKKRKLKRERKKEEENKWINNLKINKTEE